MAETINDRGPEIGKKPGSHDDLGLDPDQRRTEIENLERGFAAPAAGEGEDAASGASPDNIKTAEENPDSVKSDKTKSAGKAAAPDSDQVGKGYNPKDKTRMASIKNILLASKRRRNLVAGGGAGAAIAGLIVAAFMSILPLKLLHIVENLQKRFFATSENAIQTETEVMMSRYIKKYVVPSLSKCSGSTIDKDCNTIVGGGGNPVRNLYKAWSQAKLENTLAEKYDIVFKKVGDTYYMKAPGVPDSGPDIDENGQDITKLVDEKIATKADLEGDLFVQAKRNEVRTAVRDAMAKESRWKRFMYRFKVGRLLEKKYGIKRCIFACKTRDNIADWKDNKKKAAKTILVQRVLEPHAEILSLVLECVINTQDSCTNISKGSDGKGVNGEPLNKFQKDLQEKLNSLSQKYGAEAVEKLISDAQALADKGFTKYAVQKVVETVFTKFASEEAGKTAANATGDIIPVVGAINAAANIVKTISSASKTIKYVAYSAAAAGMVQQYMVYRSQVDECKSGHCDAAILGSFTDTLAPGQQKMPDGSYSGASAEATPLYAAIIDGQPATTSTAFLDSLFPSASAATTDDGTYKCDNGRPVPAGKLVCTEESLVQATFISGISDSVNETLSAAVSISDAWINTAGKLINFVGNTLGSIISRFPGVAQLGANVGGLVERVIGASIGKLVPSAFSDNMSGGRSFDLMAGGADVAGNDYAHHGLGGRALSNQEVTTILNQQQLQDDQSFQRSSFFAKLFDKDSDRSLVTKVAMAMPTNLSSMLSNGFSSLLHNPLSALLNGFGSMLSFGHAGAASSVDMCTDGGPFGVTCYGYASSDINNIGDPEAYWEQHCQDPTFSDNWNAAAAKNVNPATAQYENSTTNPCLLLQATVGSAGAAFDANLLTADDLSSSSSSPPPAPTTPPPSAIDKSTLFNDSTGIECAAGTSDLGIQDGYHGGQLVKIRVCAVSNLPSSGEESNGGFGVSGANGKAVVNARVSAAVYAMAAAAAKDGVFLAARSTFRTMSHQQSLCPCDGIHIARPGNSNHQMGLAIDFTGGLPSTPGPIAGNAFWDWLSAHAATYGYQNYPVEAWHWSPDGH